MVVAVTVEWRESDVVAKGMSTRPVRLATGEVVRFTREALEGMAEQVRTGFIPIVIEHLSLLPPSGRWHSAEVVTADDGADELVLYGHTFRTLRPVGEDPDPWALVPSNRPVASTDVSIASVGLEPRNFEPAIFEEARDNAPVAVREEQRWSELPPLEWVLVIPVVWGATKFLGSFLDEIGRESARAVFDWVSSLGSRAKDSERDQIITLQFALPGNDPIGPLIYGFVPIEAGAEIATDALPALDAAAPIAELAGAQAESGVMGDLQRAAFIWKDDAWHLAWWVVDDDAVRVTNWFLANEPDPARFLGRPLLPEAPPSDA
jgi:hypothetical protein